MSVGDTPSRFGGFVGRERNSPNYAMPSMRPRTGAGGCFSFGRTRHRQDAPRRGDRARGRESRDAGSMGPLLGGRRRAGILAMDSGSSQFPGSFDPQRRRNLAWSQELPRTSSTRWRRSFRNCDLHNRRRALVTEKIDAKRGSFSPLDAVTNFLKIGRPSRIQRLSCSTTCMTATKRHLRCCVSWRVS